MSSERSKMVDVLQEYLAEGYWVHLTLPKNLEAIRERGLEPGHKYTDEQLFDEYYPDREAGPVVEGRSFAENLLDRTRTEFYSESTVPSRSECVTVWPDIELGFNMRSAVLGDAYSFGVVVIDPSELEGGRLVLGEYQLIAQVMVDRQIQLAQSDGEAHGEEITNDDVVNTALNYWSAVTVTNTPDAIDEQAPMFELPEVLIRDGVSPDAIVDAFEHDLVEFDENDPEAPPGL